jgi:hypothetical protein
MRLFISHREAARRRWRYFGRPYLTVIGLAALVGLAIGIGWVIAGLVHYYRLR